MARPSGIGRASHAHPLRRNCLMLGWALCDGGQHLPPAHGVVFRRGQRYRRRIGIGAHRLGDPVQILLRQHG